MHTDEASALGVAVHYTDATNQRREVPEATRAALARVLSGHPDAPAPVPHAKAFLPKHLEGGGKAWGVAVQLYALRSRRNWGIGDFTDLAAVVRWAADLGATYVGVNPLHALFLADPGRRSPYYPSSRLFLNPIYIDPDAIDVDGEATDLHGPAVKRLIATAREGELIDYEAVTAAKRPAFEALWRAFQQGANAARKTMFAQFREGAGEALERHATFEALCEHFASRGVHGGFRSWPEAYQDPNSEDVARFAEQNEERVSFHAYLQWLARLQLQEAANVGVAAQPPTELYLDLAVGAAPDGSEVWSGGDRYASTVRLGAPPDPMAREGQDWGLAPMNPHRLAAEDYQPLRDVLAASMDHAGAIRIDHVLGYDRQFWIPEGETAAAGGYVAFPRADMIAVTAHESERARCLVVGEDLGTVPEGLTEALHGANLLSYEVARWTRRDDGRFAGPRDYPRLCLAVASTHDIEPIAGWLRGRGAEERDVTDLLALWGVSSNAEPSAVVEAAHRFLASTDAMIVMEALEDLLVQETQVNKPGTIDEHPNWRVRYARDLEEWTEDEGVRALALAGRR